MTEIELSSPHTSTGEPPSFSNRTLAGAAVVYVLILCGFWFAAKANPVGSLPHFPATFASFALLLYVLWFSAFGVAEALAAALPRWARLSTGAVLALPYVVSSAPAGQFQWRYLLTLVAIPVLLSLLVGLRQLPQKLTWQDVVALLSIAVALMSHSLSGAWPARGLGSLPKLYLADVTIFVFVIARRLEGVGYSLVPSRSALRTGCREWLFFAPIGIGLGLALRFISFYPRGLPPLRALALFAGIFLLTAIPEELFFRGVLQNLLEPRLGRLRALITASVLFGLSHFPKGALFNWRYVLLASIAGVFYGRAWRQKRQLLASSLTHAGVDTVWSLWFR